MTCLFYKLFRQPHGIPHAAFDGGGYVHFVHKLILHLFYRLFVIDEFILESQIIVIKNFVKVLVRFVHYIQNAFAVVAQRAVKRLARILAPARKILFGKSFFKTFEYFQFLYALFADIRIVENGENAYHLFQGVEIGFDKFFTEHLYKIDIGGKTCGKLFLVGKSAYIIRRCMHIDSRFCSRF